jgi:hypothetical protein
MGPPLRLVRAGALGGDQGCHHNSSGETWGIVQALGGDQRCHHNTFLSLGYCWDNLGYCPNRLEGYFPILMGIQTLRIVYSEYSKTRNTELLSCGPKWG